MKTREEYLEEINKIVDEYKTAETLLHDEQPDGWEKAIKVKYNEMSKEVTDVVDLFLKNNTRCTQHYKVYKFLPEKLQFSACCDANGISIDKDLLDDLGKNYFDLHPTLVQRKKDLFNNVKSKDCHACWLKESRGMRSMRYDQSVESYKDILQLFESEDDFDPDRISEPSRFEMWMNSTCNLGCFMCNSGNSNTLRKVWGGKWDTNNVLVRSNKEYDDILDRNFSSHHEKFENAMKERVKDRLKTAISGRYEYHERTGDYDQVTIAYLGGEPTLHNEMYEHADEFIEAAKDAIESGSTIRYEIVTNGTSKEKLSERVMTLFKKYSDAGWATRVMLSQDGTDEQANVRHGADFDAIKRNFVNWLSPNVPIDELISFTVVSNLNMPYIDNMAQYFYDSIKESNKPDNKLLDIAFNSLYSPSWMMLHHLPKKYIEQPTERALETFKKIEKDFDGIRINYRLFENLIQQATDNIDRDELLKVFNAYKYTHENFSAAYPGWSFWETFPHTVELAEEYNIDITTKADPNEFMRNRR